MNIHAPSSEICEQFRCLEWRGRRFKRNNKTYIRGFHRTLYKTFYYCFEDNFAWFWMDI